VLLHNARLADGRITSLRVCGDTVDDIGDHLVAQDGEVTDDLRGWLVVAAPAEPHAHLDKAFLAERVPNATGDLMGAIRAMDAAHLTLTVADIVERAERAARLLAANGVTAIRSHADLIAPHGLRSVEALITVRDRVRDVVDLQVCPLVGWPTIGPEGAQARALARAAIDMGVDLIGSCPHLETDDRAATDVIIEIAGEACLPLDLHTDETLDPHALGIEYLADRILTSGFAQPVAASHCVSLGVQPLDVQQRVAERVAEAGIAVIALPQTNLFLQGRQHQQAMPRAVTAVQALQQAGVIVAAGGDNLQDPFNPLGRGDPCETAGLMIATAHLLPDAAWDTVSTQARRAMGLAPAGPAVGHRADLLAINAGSTREAIAFGPAQRRTMRAGVWVDNSHSGNKAGDRPGYGQGE
jgi:cytosine/creatinine deaminase